MYVLSQTTGDSEMIYPADRCTWVLKYNSTTETYFIDQAVFYPGDDDSGNAISGTVVFGHIGKQGRFVPITRQ